jgi:colanic acid biosynthesis glycosyl transferase WcaI
VRALVEAGHQVSVATGMPNYPEGMVFAGYEEHRTLREEVDGCTVFRTAYFVTARNQKKWSQLRSYLSFAAAAFRSGLRVGAVDVVFATSPPLFVALPGVWLARLSGARLVLDLRDLWPDEIVACGAGEDKSLPVRMLRRLERWAYRAADYVTCTTPSFVETVVDRGVPREKTLMLPNGADLDLFHPLPRNNPVAAACGFGEKFVVMYTGLLGIKHGLEVILEAARQLQDDPQIHFYIVGSGARSRALRERAAEMGLHNVEFAGERRLQEIPLLLARADMCVSALLPEPYLEKIITVKLFEYLACGKPVVAAQAGEGARVLHESGAGCVVPPGDPAAMAKAIRELKHDPERRARMATAGRPYVEANFSRLAWARRLEARLRELCA